MYCFSSAITLRTSLPMATVLEPGACSTNSAAAGWLSSSARAAYSALPSSTRATSRRRVTAPSALVRTTMSPNSSVSRRRPCTLMDIWVVTSSRVGLAPMMPAAACRFSWRIAATTSLAARPRSLSFCGSSQMRMAYSPAPRTWTLPTPWMRARRSRTLRMA
ncbi:hypothetical protein D9M71_498920 [compost metagenome]